ncbi:MAG: hypothetical protein ACXVFQ_17085 [Solirubrobacteraceae bacterium]
MRTRAVVMAVVVTGGLSAATALALAANKGAIYEGAGGGGVTFTVSVSGKSITDFNGPTRFACGGLAPGSTKYPQHATISHDVFKVTSIQPARSKDITVVTGHFTKGGGVTGTIKVATQCLLPPNFNSGPVKHKTFTWSSTSEPAGKTSRWCPDMSRQVPHFGPFGFTAVIAENTTCKTVAEAIRASKVTPQTMAPPVFSTPGWTCTRSPTSGRYTCSHRKASFSWVNAP